ncbi:MAG: hypothetical protein KCHDKBKB_02220 [Elusimicrobia bacterium]|nr:hypothetical protein [Elusimicrobiota bacterium]
MLQIRLPGMSFVLIGLIFLPISLVFSAEECPQNPPFVGDITLRQPLTVCYPNHDGARYNVNMGLITGVTLKPNPPDSANWCVQRNRISLEVKNVGGCKYKFTARVTHNLCTGPNPRPLPYSLSKVMLRIVEKAANPNQTLTDAEKNAQECDRWASNENDLGSYTRDPSVKFQGVRYMGPKVHGPIVLPQVAPPPSNLADTITFETGDIDLGGKITQGKFYYAELTLQQEPNATPTNQRVGRQRVKFSCGLPPTPTPTPPISSPPPSPSPTASPTSTPGPDCACWGWGAIYDPTGRITWARFRISYYCGVGLPNSCTPCPPTHSYRCNHPINPADYNLCCRHNVVDPFICPGWMSPQCISVIKNPGQTTTASLNVSLTAASSQASQSASHFATLNNLQSIGNPFQLTTPTQGGVSPSLPVYLPPEESYPLIIQFGEGNSIPTNESTLSSEEFISIPLKNTSLSGTPHLYLFQGGDHWTQVPHQQFDGVNLSVSVTALGIYQVFVPITDLPYAFGEVYVFPNPTKDGDVPTLHIEVGQSDEVSTRIYDVAGDLVYETKVSDGIKLVNGKPCYEIPLDQTKFKSGVYTGVVTAEKSGKEPIRKQYRFSVIR